MKVSIVLKVENIKDDGTAPVYLRVFHNKEYKFYNMNISVKPSQWNGVVCEVSSGPNKKEYNLIIKDIVGRASDILMRYRVNKWVLNHDKFANEFGRNDVSLDFVKFMRNEIMNRSSSGVLKDSTCKAQLAVLNKFESFKKCLPLNDFDKQVLLDFRAFMKKNKNGINTIHNAFKTIKTYVGIAISEKILNSDPFKGFDNKQVKTYPIFLTIEEFVKLKNLYYSNKLTVFYKNVLRQFLFSCCTGLRVSDLKRFTYENLNNNELTIKPMKTETTSGVQVTIPLTKFALSLIEDECSNGVSGAIFARYHPDKLRGVLKEIVKLVDITKMVNMHTARHTFATNFLKSCTAANGILILQKLLGHSKIDSTMVYAHVINKDANSAMKEFESMIDK